MERKENGFAATGILYTILLVFLILMTTLLATLSSRSRILEKLKNDAKGKCDFEVGRTWNFTFSRSVKKMDVPCDATYKLEVWGAQGGYRSSSEYGGKGGYSVGNVSLKKEEQLYIYVGGSGHGTGFNGGGRRYTYYGGGGATDIRIGQDSLYARIIVAGGGGSDGAANKKGMYGGGVNGGSSTEGYVNSPCMNYCGKGGTNSYSGAGLSYTGTSQSSTVTGTSTAYYGGFGYGGNGMYYSNGYGGAGGGGWYGGSGTVPDGTGDDDRGGGGGSGWIFTQTNYNSWKSGNPTDANKYLLNSNYYLTDAKTISGDSSMPSPSGTTQVGQAGEGYARITLISIN